MLVLIGGAPATIATEQLRGQFGVCVEAIVDDSGGDVNSLSSGAGRGVRREPFRRLSRKWLVAREGVDEEAVRDLHSM